MAYENSNASFFKPNSDGMVMFNDNTMLKISYYDETMKFEIRVKNMEGKYPAPEAGKDNSILVSSENAAKLAIMLDVFQEKLDQYNEDFANGKDCSEYKPYSVSVFTGTTPEKTRILQITTGELTEHGFVPEIALHVGVDQNRAALLSYVFKTRVTPLLINYDPKTGDVEMLNKMGQYELINLAIRNFANFSSKAVRHFNKSVVNDEKLNKTENLIKLIADHFNLSLPEYNNSYTREPSPFESFNNNNVTPPVVEGGDLGTLLGTQNYR